MAAPHPSPTKADLRRLALARRNGAPAQGGPLLADHLCGYLAHAPPAAVIAGYWPIGSEIDPLPALRRLHAAGISLALPQTTPPGSALRFRAWAPGDALVPGRSGTQHPLGDEIMPDLLLVPLLGFDRDCHRLGYGGGYYDRTLAASPWLRAIGCAYAAQQLDELPTTAYDVALHAVATEHGMIEPRRC